MRFRTIPKLPPEPDKPRYPFPMTVFLVGFAPDGEEICRWDLGVRLTDFRERIHLPEQNIGIEVT